MFISDIQSTRRFGRSLYSRLQVIGCHCTDRFLILGYYVSFQKVPGSIRPVILATNIRMNKIIIIIKIIKVILNTIIVKDLLV
jgi:hypothetical protein